MDNGDLKMINEISKPDRYLWLLAKVYGLTIDEAMTCYMENLNRYF